MKSMIEWSIKDETVLLEVYLLWFKQESMMMI